MVGGGDLKTFEETMAEIDAVLRELGSGVPLERQAELFERGQRLVGEADEALKTVERRIEIVTPHGVEAFEG
jgi:exodeoxyribonuclease VII small subunit